MCIGLGNSAHVTIPPPPHPRVAFLIFQPLPREISPPTADRHGTGCPPGTDLEIRFLSSFHKSPWNRETVFFFVAFSAVSSAKTRFGPFLKVEPFFTFVWDLSGCTAAVLLLNRVFLTRSCNNWGSTWPKMAQTGFEAAKQVLHAWASRKQTKH